MVNDSPQDRVREGHRVYSTPTLIDYGPVAKLTQGSLAVNNDAVTGMTMAQCL